jgi:hypothetical protein
MCVSKVCEWPMWVDMVCVHSLMCVANIYYTSQPKKRYKGLMLNIFYIEKKDRQQSYNLDSYGHDK